MNERPWVSKIPSLKESVEKEILFPTDEEEGGGIVYLAWRTSNLLWRDFKEKEALDVLFTYLTESAVSPLLKEMVEIEDPYCGSVSFEVTDTVEPSIYFHFDNISTKKLSLIKEKFFDVLSNVIKTGIDMKRMKSIIQRKKVNFLNDFEEEPHRNFSHYLINYFLYQTKIEDLEEAFKEVERLDLFEKEESKYWIDLLLEYIIDKKYVCIIGKPSIEFGEKQQDEEDDRIEKQINDLGDDKLDELEEILEENMKKNNIPVPENILKSFKIPDTNSIKFIPVYTYRSNEVPKTDDSKRLQMHLNDENQDIPIFIQFDRIFYN